MASFLGDKRGVGALLVYIEIWIFKGLGFLDQTGNHFLLFFWGGDGV